MISGRPTSVRWWETFILRHRSGKIPVSPLVLAVAFLVLWTRSAGSAEPGASPLSVEQTETLRAPDTAKRSGAGPDTAKRSEAGPDTAKRSEAGPDTAKRSEAGPIPGRIRWKAVEAGLLPAVTAGAESGVPKRSEAGLDTAKRSEAGLDTAKRSEAGSTTAVLSAKGQRRKVVQFDRIPTGPERAALEASGVKLLRYVGDNAFFAHVQGSREAAAAAEAVGAIFAQEVQKEHKLHPMLLKGEFPDYAKFKAPATKGVLNVEPRYDKAHRLPAAVLNRNVAALVARAECKAGTAGKSGGRAGESGSQTCGSSGEIGKGEAQPAKPDGPGAKSGGQTGTIGGQAGQSDGQAAASAAEVDTIALYVLFHPDVDLDTEAVEVIHNHGGVVRSVMRTINAAVVWIPQSNLDALAQDDAVQWVEPPLPTLEGNCIEARWRTEARNPADPNQGLYGLEGQGVTVMLYDVGSPYIEHPDLKDRVILHDADPGNYTPDRHATCMAGIIGGNGTCWRDPNYYVIFDPNANLRGIAAHCTILSYVADFGEGFPEQRLYADPGDLEADYIDGQYNGAEIINNSIGMDLARRGLSIYWEGNYGIVCMLLDALVRGGRSDPNGEPLPPMRVIQASGNDGHTAYFYPLVYGPYGLIPPPATAKNIISVGAGYANDANSMTLWQIPGCYMNFEWMQEALWYDYPEDIQLLSFGPTDDGRIKPDFSAPGLHLTAGFYPNGGYCEWVTGGSLIPFMPTNREILSTCWTPEHTPPGVYWFYSYQTYPDDVPLGGSDGTSAACAVVTGLCAQVLEDFKTQHPGAPLPRNSTLKALFSQHAVQYYQGPIYQRGFGHARLKPVIDAMREGSFLEDVVDHGGEKVYYVEVPPDSNNLKVTIAWDDAPGGLNTNPELVNDLDVVAVSPGGAVHYPWTLDPNQPASPGVRTQADHINNIEQIRVDEPNEGLWTIRVSGYSVPDGPQPFSITFTPTQRTCSSKGQISLDRDKYGCTETAGITLVDCDLNVNTEAIDSVTVLVSSPNAPSGLEAVLSETDYDTGRFSGMFDLSGLHLGNGDMIAVTYQDANIGDGNTATVQDTATADCEPPVISDIGIHVGDDYVVSVTFNTNEPAVGAVRYGTSCGALTKKAVGGSRQTSHSIQLVELEPNYSLEPNVTYYYAVDAVDDANNMSTDANDGSCYSFTYVLREKYFTQLLHGINDPNLANWSILFRPDGSNAFYTACGEPITALPTDPNLGQALPPGQDGCMRIILNRNRVSLYGQAYGSRSRPVYVGANGYLAFGYPDWQIIPSCGGHFGQPRVSGFYTRLASYYEGDPNTCSVRWQQSDDRLTVTWWNVYDVYAGCRRHVQIEMYFDGRIRIAWMGGVNTAYALVGLSEGFGIPPDFEEDDIRTYPRGPCPCRTLTLNVQTPELGGVVLDPNDPNWPPFTYTNGKQVHLTAQPIGSNIFDRWELYDPDHPGDANYVATDVNNPLSIVMNADREVTAVFLGGSGKCGRGVELGLPLALGVVVCTLVARRLRSTR